MPEPKDDDHCHPVFNVGESIGKTVGSRQPPRGLSSERSRKADKIRWRQAFGGVGIPKGVYKFHSHEEADEWMTSQMAMRAARRKS